MNKMCAPFFAVICSCQFRIFWMIFTIMVVVILGRSIRMRNSRIFLIQSIFITQICGKPCKQGMYKNSMHASGFNWILPFYSGRKKIYKLNLYQKEIITKIWETCFEIYLLIEMNANFSLHCQMLRTPIINGHGGSNLGTLPL